MSKKQSDDHVTSHKIRVAHHNKRMDMEDAGQPQREKRCADNFRGNQKNPRRS